MITSARCAARLLSDVTRTLFLFFDWRAFRVDRFRLVTMTSEARPELAIPLATASPIFPAPITAIINGGACLSISVLITSVEGLCPKDGEQREAWKAHLGASHGERTRA